MLFILLTALLFCLSLKIKNHLQRRRRRGEELSCRIILLLYLIKNQTLKPVAYQPDMGKVQKAVTGNSLLIRFWMCVLLWAGGRSAKCKPKLLLQGAKSVEVYLQEDKPLLIKRGSCLSWVKLKHFAGWKPTPLVCSSPVLKVWDVLRLL